MLTVSAVNDAPVLTAGGTLAYTENQAATAIDGTITVTDVDSTNLVGATIQITRQLRQRPGRPVLRDRPLGITGTFNATTGTLTLTGTTTRRQLPDGATQRPVRQHLERSLDAGPDGHLAGQRRRRRAQPEQYAHEHHQRDRGERSADGHRPTNLPAQAGIPITYPAASWAGPTSRPARRHGRHHADSVTGGTVTKKTPGPERCTSNSASESAERCASITPTVPLRWSIVHRSRVCSTHAKQPRMRVVSMRRC